MRYFATYLLTIIIVIAGCSKTNPVDGNEKTNQVQVGPGSLTSDSPHLAALHELQSAFHGAIRNSDSEAMRSLWADDATIQVGEASASGPSEIVAFFEGVPPFINGWASLAPTYKSKYEIQGNQAEYAFECVYVEETGALTGNSVIAHLNATGTMRKVGNRWLFEHFQGGAGPLP